MITNLGVGLEAEYRCGGAQASGVAVVAPASKSPQPRPLPRPGSPWAWRPSRAGELPLTPEVRREGMSVSGNYFLH